MKLEQSHHSEEEFKLEGSNLSDERFQGQEFHQSNVHDLKSSQIKSPIKDNHSDEESFDFQNE